MVFISPDTFKNISELEQTDPLSKRTNEREIGNNYKLRYGSLTLEFDVMHVLLLL